MDQSHRKRIKHYEAERHVHELTFSCLARQPLLANDLWRGWFCEILQGPCVLQDFLLLAYVLMPEHVHLLVCPGGSTSRIPNFLGDLKRIRFGSRARSPPRSAHGSAATQCYDLSILAGGPRLRQKSDESRVYRGGD